MSNELMDSLARQAEAGGTLYDGRDMDDAVVAPARRRVRRAHTLRAAGTLGVTALVIAGGLTAALEWQGDRGTVAPAVTDVPDEGEPLAGLTAEDLLVDTAERTRQDSVATRQAAALCTYDEKSENPWSSAEVGTVGMGCPAVWVGDRPMLMVTGAGAHVEPDGSLDVTWTLTNISDEAIVIDKDAITLGLLTDPGAVADGGHAGMQIVVSNSLWLEGGTRNIDAAGESDPISLAPGETLDGGELLTPGMLDGDEVPDLIENLSAGTLEPTITLQVRIPPAGDVSDTELFLETSAQVTPTGTMDPASAAFADLEPRTRGEQRDDAQAGFACHVGRENPRTNATDPDDDPWTNASCDAVWIPGGPQVELTQFAWEPDMSGDYVNLTWTATNVSDHDVYLDAASAGLTVDMGDEGYVMNSSGATIGWSQWISDSSRYVNLSTNSDAVTLGAGESLHGEHGIPEEKGWKSAEKVVTIRVVRDDDENGDRELFLELPWEG